MRTYLQLPSCGTFRLALAIGALLVLTPALAVAQNITLEGEITHFLQGKARIAPGGSHDMKTGKFVFPGPSCQITRDGAPASFSDLKIGDMAKTEYFKDGKKGFSANYIHATSTNNSGRAPRKLFLKLNNGKTAWIDLNKKKGSTTTTSGGGTSTSKRGGKKKLSRAQIRRLLVAVCRKNDQVKQCVQLRRKCNQKTWPRGSDLGIMCGELGWGSNSGGGGAGGSKNVMNVLVGYQYTSVGDPSLFGTGVESAWHGLRLRATSIPAKGLMSLSLDAEISKAGENWFYDLGLMVGAGSWVQKKYGIALVGGIGTSGISGDTLAQAWQIPAEVVFTGHINRKLTISAFARATWLLQGDEAKLMARKRGSGIASFADQFSVGVFAYYGTKTAYNQNKKAYGLHAGVVMTEMLGGSYFGAVIGVGQSQTPRARSY